MRADERKGLERLCWYLLRSAVMPSVDYFSMSDRELSDIVAYIQSMPPVDNTVPKPTTGPVGTVLMATGQMLVSAELVADHNAPHTELPPEVGVNVAYGKHITQVCKGCHGEHFEGGPVFGGDPAWPAAASLTPHSTGMKDWTFEDFTKVMLEGIGPDGEPVQPPMAGISTYAANYTDIEMRAMWTFLQSLEPRPSHQGQRRRARSARVLRLRFVSRPRLGSAGGGAGTTWSRHAALGAKTP